MTSIRWATWFAARWTSTVTVSPLRKADTGRMSSPAGRTVDLHMRDNSGQVGQAGGSGNSALVDRNSRNHDRGGQVVPWNDRVPNAELLTPTNNRGSAEYYGGAVRRLGEAWRASGCANPEVEADGHPGGITHDSAHFVRGGDDNPVSRGVPAFPAVKTNLILRSHLPPSTATDRDPNSRPRVRRPLTLPRSAGALAARREVFSISHKRLDWLEQSTLALAAVFFLPPWLGPSPRRRRNADQASGKPRQGGR